MSRYLAVCLHVAIVASAGCSHDHAHGPPSVAISLSPTSIPQGGTTTLTVTVENFTLVGGEHTHDEGAAHDGHAAAEGHYHVYLDTTDENPILMSGDPIVDLVVDGEPGAHEVIVRLHDLSHRIVEPEVTDRATITLEEAGGGGSGGAGSGGAGGS